MFAPTTKTFVTKKRRTNQPTNGRTNRPVYILRQGEVKIKKFLSVQRGKSSLPRLRQDICENVRKNDRVRKSHS